MWPTARAEVLQIGSALAFCLLCHAFFRLPHLPKTFSFIGGDSRSRTGHPSFVAVAVWVGLLGSGSAGVVMGSESESVVGGSTQKPETN